ncbi:cytoplasmic polyadenylation element-binding protein 3 isoform X3 [Rhinatrema bivittatum]|nr:cytoplasmic polyadenylation element-binding protein 3 isoform X3 [Rhinatrema bivittatum]XP_029465786.1 cytoplasmic polyadenylation element-binding protein 3 isoform X3 [Rhinatrema bivittatum]XP_029465787.1 cytoplasmic polyadenylation element-binding protein 3 isoform X3 [Rhinatrema bivittatum]XP_029465789.1 cytoplasmic polyadenylation element-binding protein 3 isoform X3 [Rhinatrema bivittatum]XP_029465790.1 cytoplasmic polyadenylation element-binding protein 3 isoform X3 [Rhinatrema bivitta
MQDDLLMDKSKAQPQQRQQQQPPQAPQQQQQQDPSSEAPSTSLVLDTPKSEDSAVTNISTTAAAQINKEKMQMESPLLPGLSFHQAPQEPAATSLSPSFGSTWSTGTANAVDDSFFQGITSVNGTMLFQNFPHHVNPVFGGTFSPQIGLAHQTPHQQQQQQPQQAQQQQQRRSPVSPNQAPFPQRNAYSHQPIMTNKPSSSSAASSSSWNNHQNAAWSTPSNPWGGLQAGRDPRRAVGVGVGVGVGIPSPLNPISPLKKPFSSNVIAPPKFPRAAPLTPKSWMEDNAFRADNGNSLPFQDRNRPYDAFNLHSLENSLMDMIRTDHEPLKGKHYPPSGPPMSFADIMWRNHFAGRMGINFHHTGADNIMALNTRSYGRRRVIAARQSCTIHLCVLETRWSQSSLNIAMQYEESIHSPGRSSLFPFEDGFLDDSHGDQSLSSGLSSPTRCQNGERVERYSRKVFVGGLPPDIDEDEITASFRRFGPLVVDWPHKAESKSYFPPKGYAFLLFQEESSVQALIDACLEEDGKLYLCVSSPTIKDKPVQIRPWNLSDSDFVMDGSQPLDPRKTIFVGGVPRPLRAVELAMIMDRLYGGVCYAGIDTDPELKYPKGAGRVAFSNQQSYIAAISARFVQLQHNDIDKRVEVKPYVLDDQMCDECQGTRCAGKFAPFFCANVTCLQYYCEYCWASIHSRAGREFHKPLVKEGGDRPRHVPFRWS